MKTPPLEPHSSSMNRHQLTEYEALAKDGHGWVLPRPDGTKANCGGPNVCRVCLLEKLVYSQTQQTVIIEAMNIKPGDQILLLAPAFAKPSDLDHITEKLRAQFPEVGITIMAGFTGVQIHRQDPSV